MTCLVASFASSFFLHTRCSHPLPHVGCFLFLTFHFPSFPHVFIYHVDSRTPFFLFSCFLLIVSRYRLFLYLLICLNLLSISLIPFTSYLTLSSRFLSSLFCSPYLSFLPALPLFYRSSRPFIMFLLSKLPTLSHSSYSSSDFLPS